MGAAFFFECEDFGARFDESFPRLALFFSLFFFFFFLNSGGHIAHTNATFLGQDQSKVAHWAEMTVDERSPTSCM